MPDAPAGDALAAAREKVARWLRCATPSYVRAEIRTERERMEAERLADLDAYGAAARAEGAAEALPPLREGWDLEMFAQVVEDCAQAFDDLLLDDEDRKEGAHMATADSARWLAQWLRDLRARARSPSSGTEAQP